MTDMTSADGVANASGTARPTLAAVAALAGVSASTASLAFSGAGPVSTATRERVHAAAARLGYAGPDPRARSLRRGRSGIVGVVLEDRIADAFRDPMNIAMLDGIADETGSRGASLLLLTETGPDSGSIASAAMDGVILIGCSTSLEESVGVLRQRGLPIVAIEARDLDSVLPIGLDNRDASARAARHLVELGHRRIAVATLPLESSHAAGALPPDWVTRGTSHTTLERLRGVADVLGEVEGVVASESSIDAGQVAGTELLTREPRPTAIIAQSDLIALGIIRAADALGLTVPADVSVVGFDGIATHDDRHDLTTFVQPAVEKGRAAGRAVMAMLDGETPEPRDFTSEFHAGDTTAALSPA